jgi:methyltransferase-like protein
MDTSPPYMTCVDSLMANLNNNLHRVDVMKNENGHLKKNEEDLNKKVEDHLKKMEDEPINLIGCGTIVNSPSSLC